MSLDKPQLSKARSKLQSEDLVIYGKKPELKAGLRAKFVLATGSSSTKPYFFRARDWPGFENNRLVPPHMGETTFELLLLNCNISSLIKEALSSLSHGAFVSSRFTQLYDKWTYDKSENLSIDELSSDRFTHLLVEVNDADKTSVELRRRLESSHELVDQVSAFNGIELAPKSFPGFQIRKKKAISVFKRK